MGDQDFGRAPSSNPGAPGGGSRLNRCGFTSSFRRTSIQGCGTLGAGSLGEKLETSPERRKKTCPHLIDSLI